MLPASGAPRSSTRLIGLVEGEAASAMSGVAGRLLAALDRHLTVVGSVDYAPAPLARAALAAATFHPRRSHWRARFHTSPLAHRALSATLARRAARVQGQFDLALQVHGWVGRQPRPYALYVDQTRLMAHRGWPAWLPLSARERGRVLEAEGAMYARAAHILTMGEPARSSLIADYGVAGDRITVVGGGLMFDAAVLSAATGPTSEPTILFVGREFHRKGGPCLLEAFTSVRRQVPTARLLLVGVEKAPRADGVEALGLVRNRAQLSALYRRARAFCLPTRYEPYGFVFIEAMAHGVPCVGTRVGSVPDILDDGRAGLLVEPDDPQALADALVRLLADDELADAIAAAGLDRVAESLLWEHVAARAAPVLERAART